MEIQEKVVLKPKNKKWIYAGVVLAVLLLIGIPLARNAMKGETGEKVPDEVRVLPVEVAKVAARPFGDGVNVAGTVSPSREATVSPKVMGKVSSIHIKVGQQVKAGQTLFELDKSDALVALKQAEAGLALAEAGKARAEADLENALINYERTEKLFQEGAVAKSALEQAKGALAAAQSGKAVNAASIMQAQAAIESAGHTLGNLTVTAPITGLVSKCNVDLGEIVSQQTPGVVLIQNSPLLVKVNLSENVVTRVTLKQEVEVAVSATGKTYKGVVSTLAPQADQVTRAYPAEIELKNTDNLVRPGMAAELRITTNKVAGALVVPTDALLQQEGGSVVFVAENGVARQRKVTTGMTGQGYTQIVGGLEEGQEVVVRGNRLLVEGAKIKVEKQWKEAPARDGGGQS